MRRTISRDDDDANARLDVDIAVDHLNEVTVVATTCSR